MSYALLSIVKILDNIITTFKSLATYREQKILSSILVVISQLIFYLVISQVINDNTLMAIIVVSVSSGIGNYIALLINKRVKRDTKWTFVIASNNKNDIRNLCNYLMKHNIKHIAMDGYTRRGEHTIHVMVFSKNKEDSRLIEGFLAHTKSKFLKEVI